MWGQTRELQAWNLGTCPARFLSFSGTGTGPGNVRVHHLGFMASGPVEWSQSRVPPGQRLSSNKRWRVVAVSGLVRLWSIVEATLSHSGEHHNFQGGPLLSTCTYQYGMPTGTYRRIVGLEPVHMLQFNGSRTVPLLSIPPHSYLYSSPPLQPDNLSLHDLHLNIITSGSGASSRTSFVQCAAHTASLQQHPLLDCSLSRICVASVRRCTQCLAVTVTGFNTTSFIGQHQ